MIKQERAITTQMVTAWLITTDGKDPAHFYLGVLEIDSIDIIKKKFSLAGMVGTFGGDQVYALPDSGFDIELKIREGGQVDYYPNSRRLFYMTRSRVVERYTGPIETFDTDEVLKMFAGMECDILEYTKQAT